METGEQQIPLPTEPRRIGKYEIVASLGRGGAGEVFLALASGLGGFQKLVVVKMLHSHFEEDANVVEMFLDEARLAARLSHPNVVQTLEVGVDGDRHFIAMTYLEGLPLHRILARFGKREMRLPPGVCARIVAEVLDGLAYAHGLSDYDGSPLNIVHRDVSPANIFVCWDGTIKLLDFGIAKAERRRANTDSGIIKGKFGYISPEQATGESVDARADLWSCGVVLWELLSSRRLFPNLNDVTTLRKLIAGRIPHVSEVVDGVPAPLVAVIERALQRDPNERWPDAESMKSALEEFLASLPTETTRDEIAECIGDVFAGERGQQQALVRDCVGGAKLAATPSGSFRVRDETSQRILTVPPPHETPVRLPKAPFILALLACGSLGAIVAGSSWATPAPAETPATTQTESEAESEGEEAESESESEGEAEAERPTEQPIEETVQRGSGSGSPEVPRGETEIVTRTPRTQPGEATPEQAAEATEAAVEPTTEAEPAGWLTLATTPWARVRLGGQILGTTPLVRVELPAGNHVLQLENDERQVRMRYTVEIRAGETTRRNIAIE